MAIGEHDPVEDGEFLLRRTHHQVVLSADGVKLCPMFAFLPRCEETGLNDHNGISLFRRRFVSPEAVRAAIKKNPLSKSIVEVAVESIRSIRMREDGGGPLTVVAQPEPTGPPGHCLVPEICCAEPRELCKSVSARIAKTARVVLEPAV